MELAYIILLILAIIYVPFYIWVRVSPEAEKHNLVKYGPTVMFKTGLGIKLMDRLSKYHRFWNFFGILSQIISLMLMVCIVYVMIVGIMNISNNLSSDGIGVEYALAIPGINPLLPFWYGVLGLVVAMVIHELAHGMQSRTNGVRVKSTGLLYAVVPLGAFVEPDEEDVQSSSRKVKLNLYSAGISTNFIAAAATFFIFAVLMLGSISSPYGDSSAVYSQTEDSPSYLADIPSGAIITEINGYEYTYSDDYTVTYPWDPGELVDVTYVIEDRTDQAKIRWGLYIETVSSGSPADGVLDEGTFILSVTNDGETVRMYSYNAFTSYMKTTHGGDDVTISCMTADGSSTYDAYLTLESKDGKGFIGIVTSTSGMYFTTPDSILETARNPFANADSLPEMATAALSYLASPFSGFDPLPSGVEWWYDVPMESVFWILLSALYWIFWLNIMLGISNALPAYPFDGGYIFKGWLDYIMEKLGIKDAERREKMLQSATGSVSTLVIFLFVIMIFAVVL